MKSKPRYFALHVDGLRNGSFFRVHKDGMIGQFINGDYMGGGPSFLCAGPIVNGLPTTYYQQPLVEYQAKDAEKLIPACCGGKH